MKQILAVVLLLAVLPLSFGQAPPVPAQPSDREAFSKTMRLSDPAEKVKALEAFIKDFPSSRSLGAAYSQLFMACVSLHVSGKAPLEPAFKWAEKSIETAIERAKPSAYNTVARELAEKNLVLDKAAEYINAGVELARKLDVSKRLQAMLLDTRAGILMKQGKPAEAEKEARDALAMMPEGDDSLQENAGYNGRLGSILAKVGKNHEEAADLLGKALLGRESKENAAALEELLKKQGATDPQAAKVAQLKKSGDAFIAAATNKPGAQSRIALAYSRLGILPEEAMSLARAAADNLTPKSPVDTVYQSSRTYGIALSGAGRHQEAVAVFRRVRQLASYFDLDFHLRYGGSLAALGRENEALDVYMGAAAVGQPPKVMEVLTPLYKKLKGSDEGLKADLRKISDETAAFRPAGPARKGRKGQVVLAELFTGSECGPCLSADKAFDLLTEGYDPGSVAVLEYHLHIPGPDPMTNPDTEARSKYYSVRGTPTAIVGGLDEKIGGGPLSGAKASYDTYSFAIDRRIDDTPPADVRLTGSVAGAVVTVNVQAEARQPKASLKLRIALVEEPIHYEGSNGWKEHRAVVRQLIGGAQGIELVGGKAAYSGTVDIAALGESLGKYIAEVEKEPRKLTFKEKRSEVNPANLALVAFVQDDDSREVLQAARVSLTK